MAAQPVIMNSLGYYVFRQITGPLIFFTVALTALVWLTQSLRLLDVVIQQGQSAGTFIELSVLVMPSLLGLILPVSFFCAAIYSLNRMHTDSELVVMWSAGMGRWGIAKPVIALGVFVAIIVLAVNLYFMPSGMRAMKDRVFEIRADLVAFLLREGQFTNPIKGLTVYVREMNSSGEIKGLLVYDDRKPTEPITYLAERGAVAQTEDGPRLLMINGNVQRASKDNENQIAFLQFDRYVLDLNQFSQEVGVHTRETSERYLPELFYPDPDHPWDSAYWDRLIAEGHNRLASPLYAIAFATIALAALIGGDFSRRGYVNRISLAVLFAVAIRMSGIGIQSAASKLPLLNSVQYAIPIAAIIVCCVIIESGGVSAWRNRARDSDRSLNASTST